MMRSGRERIWTLIKIHDHRGLDECMRHDGYVLGGSCLGGKQVPTIVMDADGLVHGSRLSDAYDRGSITAWT